MWPARVEILGLRLSIWELSLLAGVVVGYAALHRGFVAAPAQEPPRHLWLRYLITVYVAVLGAQLFSYAFDYGTTLAPPVGRSAVSYYLNPLAGAKTLYGAIVVLPVAVFLGSTPWRDLRFGRALDHWTPALMIVLAIARVGCFMQGCCYGTRSEMFGLSLAPGSVVYYAQRRANLIGQGAWTLPVVPTQLISAIAVAVIARWCYRRLQQGDTGLFGPAIAAYSLFRLTIEFVRDDAARNFYGPLSTSQWIAFAILAVYAVWVFWRHAHAATA